MTPAPPFDADASGGSCLVCGLPLLAERCAFCASADVRALGREVAEVPPDDVKPLLQHYLHRAYEPEPVIERVGYLAVIRSPRPAGCSTYREREALRTLRAAGVAARLTTQCGPVCVRRFGHEGECCDGHGRAL